MVVPLGAVEVVAAPTAGFACGIFGCIGGSRAYAAT